MIRQGGEVSGRARSSSWLENNVPTSTTREVRRAEGTDVLRPETEAHCTADGLSSWETCEGELEANPMVVQWQAMAGSEGVIAQAEQHVEVSTPSVQALCPCPR